MALASFGISFIRSRKWFAGCDRQQLGFLYSFLTLDYYEIEAENKVCSAQCLSDNSLR